jgi:agmatine deiminase
MKRDSSPQAEREARSAQHGEAVRSAGDAGFARVGTRRYRMPAEWERHAATWLAWPHNPETWPGCLEEARAEFEKLAAELARFEPVELLVCSPELREQVAKRMAGLPDAARVRLHVVASDDVWMRDIGPTFVRDAAGRLAAIDWTFNSWGGKYPPWDRDDAVAARVAGLCGVPHLRPGLVIEGGALEVDGEGTLLATEPTMLDPRRNPGVSRRELEQRLAGLLGVSRVVWLGEGIEGDDTDGHIDDVARFVRPGRVVCAREPDARDPNHGPLEEMAARLRAARDAAGRALEVIDLPMPEAVRADGERLPASYANFYLCNGAALVPVFGVARDAAALEVLRDCLPGREVVPIPSRHLVRGLGAVHCLTQQQPAAQ